MARLAYNEKLADEICGEIAAGGALRELCRVKADWPAERTVYQWLEEHPEFAQQYARARELQAHGEFDEIKTIADNARDANIARLQIDARKWRAGKLAPKVYGDKVINEITGKDGEALLPTKELGAAVAFALRKASKADVPS